MAVTTIKISSNNLPAGYSVMPTNSIRESKNRIKEAMKATVKDYQRKRLMSLEKASKTFVSK